MVIAVNYSCIVNKLKYTHYIGTFGKSIATLVDIKADVLLFIFLPPLIFGEAMSLNWYHVKGNGLRFRIVSILVYIFLSSILGGLIQSIILAGPGVLIGAGLMGLIAKLLLGKI